ncbi:hypothetical protein SAMN05421804_101540 [Proteiniclasticum ruminis]|uniref:Uncharacterized protein n=1 Tax=Proteiniclasticum ruminis TaxID=398199 RepID=A0A1G8HCD4_9CLOT|nr:hypothetical protein SAMN05421804_101540 [Proteiniclasticum ruminis]
MKRNMNIQKKSKPRFSLKLKETFETCIDFYKLKPLYRILIYIGIPIMIALIGILTDWLFPLRVEISLFSFMNDYLNISLTIVTLFVTFSMGYLSFIVGGNNESLNDLKNTISAKYSFNGRQINLYKIIYIDISYAIFTEIIMIGILLMMKFMVLVLPNIYIKILLYLTIFLFGHIILLLFRNVKNIYYVFFSTK